jgi:hypothetical protein
MPGMRRFALVTLGFAALAGCGDDPADVAGEYSVNVTNRDNGCMFEDWTEGDTATGIPVSITQDGSSVTAEVGGLTRALLLFWLGGATFTGTVRGDQLDLQLQGTRSMSSGNCAYTMDAVIDAEVRGDTLSGEIRYEARTNNQPDCGTLTGCATVQGLSGARPPRP